MIVRKNYIIVVAAHLIWLCSIWNYSYSQVVASSSPSLFSAYEKGKFLTSPFENKVFIEEQGQFRKILDDNKIILPGTILYAVNNPEFNAYFTSAGITFVFAKTEKTDKEEEDKKGEAQENIPLMKWETVNMQWENTDPSMHITAKEKVNNYYTYGKYHDNSQYDHVLAYKKLYYSTIYEGVDAEFELPEKGGIKYQFIVHAGFKIPSIAYHIGGAKNIYKDEKGDLHIESSLGNLIDKAPSAFTKTSQVPLEYVISGNRVEIIPDKKMLPLTEDLVIDPWIIDPTLPTSNIACDVQEDSIGNVFVNGGTSGVGNYQVQKYNSAGVLIWSHNYSCMYYGAIAVANSGSVYYSDGISGKVTKLSSAGSLIYSITEGSENWRLSFNRSKTILAMGGNFGASSLTKIDTATGVMGSTVSYPSDTWAIATDCNGDIYSLHYGSSPCILRKTNANFTPAASLITSFCITGYANVRAYASGYNAITISGPYLYIYDGLELRRFLKNTLTFVNSVSVLHGTANNCSGIAFDYCGNIYVGTMSTIEKYDMLLNPVSSIPAPNIVYDIKLAGNGDLLACGKSFVGNFGPTCPMPPQLAVSSSSTNVSCNPGTASVFATGGTSPYSYFWQSGGQTTATINGLTPGKYSFIVNDAFCQTKHDSVSVLQTSLLSATCSLIRKPTCFGFTNGSAYVSASGGTPPYTYSWNTSPVQLNDTASGLPAGTYTVTVIDADSCVKKTSITLTQPIVLASTASPNVVSCFAGNDGSATVTPTGGTIPYTYSWNTTPVQTGVTAGNLIAGSYTCTVTDSNLCTTNCSAIVTQPNVLFIDVIPADTICAGQNSILAALAHDGNSGGYTYTWNAPAFVGQNNTVSPTTTTTYSIVAMDSKSCLSAQQTVTVKVNPLPTASIGGTVAVCQDATAPDITFTGAIGAGPYTFTYAINGGAHQTVSTTSGNSVTISAPTAIPGSYTYSLLGIKDASSTTCFNTQTGNVVVTVNPSPIATFSNTTVCNTSATQFTDNSTTASGTISSWGWNFNDGSAFNTSSTPAHTYTNAGNYNVTLIVNNNFGCADTVTKPVQVYYNPTATFNHSDVCFRDTMYFTNTSTVNLPASLLSYLWVFGDGGTTSNLKNPSHYYVAPGAYTVTLIAITTDGCSGVANAPVKAFDPPASAFTFNNTCLFNSAVFTNATVSPSLGSTANWSWNFGDGSPLNTSILSPQHLYSNPGNYQVTLITHSSNLGCPDTLQSAITVFPMPDAKFGFANVCLNQPTDFNDSSMVSNGSIAGWSWNFDDGTALSTAQNPSHTYVSPGTYSVTLIVTTNNGCKDTISRSVVVHPLPIAQFNTVNVCNGTPVHFTDGSHIFATDTIQSWKWNFADGSPFISNQSPLHFYAAAGTYPVQLLVISKFGCKDSISKTSIVNPNPVVKFIALDTIGCEPLCVSFKDTSSIITGSNIHWLWTFGDGSLTSISQNTLHCYTTDSVFSPDYFTVTLTVTSDSGCVSTKLKNNYITLYPKPNASFMVQPQLATNTDPVISMFDLTTGANFWNWNFGDRDTTSIHNTLPHTYADTGTYVITLVTSTLFNCKDTAYQTIIIEPDFLFYIPTAFTPNDDGVNDSFSGKGVFLKDYEMMIFDRWGELIFYSADINKPWDGTANHGSEIAKTDIYIYTIKVTDINKRKHSYKGHVTLVR